MLKKIPLVLSVLISVSACLTACSAPKKPENPVETTLSFEEKMSYYDSLADAGEVASVEATDPGALYRVTGNQVLMNAQVYTDIINIFNKFYPEIYYKYGSEYYEPIVTLNFDPTYLRDDPGNVIGNTINININWFNENPNKASVIIYYIASTVLDYNHSAPEWVEKAINYYIAAEFDASGYDFSGIYNGGTYENDAATAADFFYWIKSTHEIDIAYRLNKKLISSSWYDEEFWIEETGRTLERLWNEYRS